MDSLLEFAQQHAQNDFANATLWNVQVLAGCQVVTVSLDTSGSFPRVVVTLTEATQQALRFLSTYNPGDIKQRALVALLQLIEDREEYEGYRAYTSGYGPNTESLSALDAAGLVELGDAVEGQRPVRITTAGRLVTQQLRFKQTGV